MSDEKRIDLSTDAPGRRHVHLRGFHGDYGENEGVLSIVAMISESPNYPESGRIIVGSPVKSPLIPGYIPTLGGFSCSPDAADLLADELRAAAAAARAAMEAGR